MWNLILSVLTVVAVLLFFIGFKNGILIGSGLIFSIFGTLIYMQFSGITLQRMLLAAIIIAMGMLVDNAIVVYDVALVNMQRGMRKKKSHTGCRVGHFHAAVGSDPDCGTDLSSGLPVTAYHW